MTEDTITLQQDSLSRSIAFQSDSFDTSVPHSTLFCFLSEGKQVEIKCT